MSQTSSTTYVDANSIPGFLSAQGLIFRRRGGEYEVKICPVCQGDTSKADNQNKLYVNAAHGAFCCQRCGTKGSWTDFQRNLGAAPARLEATLFPTEYSRSDTQRLAEETWKETMALSDPKAEPGRSYFTKRGLELPYSEVVRFHPSLFHADAKSRLPGLVFKVAGPEGKGVAIHRIFLDAAGNKAPVAPNKMALGPLSGAAIKFDQPNGVLHIAEGPETALAIRQTLKQATWSAISAGGLERLAIPETVSRLYVWADLDRSKTGEDAAHALAMRAASESRKVYVLVPPGPVPDEKKGIDWLDILNGIGLHGITGALSKSSPVEAQHSNAWSPPLPLPSLQPEAPTLPPLMLPLGIREWLEDISERMQVPLELPAATAIVALGAAIGRRCKVLPKAHDDWGVHPNLWGALIAPPSTLKSPVMKEVHAPLELLAAEEQASYLEAAKESLAELKIIDAQEKALNKDLEISLREDGPNAPLAIDSIKRRLVELDERRERNRVRSIRFIVNDATVEKIGELLSDNPGGLLLVRDELHGFLKGLEKQGRETDRAFYLEAWNGSGRFAVDRISRGTVHVPALCMSVFGGIQPSVIQRHFSEAVNDGASEDGFFSRFQVTVFPEISKVWRRVDRAPDMQARQRAESIFRYLMKLGNPENPIALHFDEGAQELFNKWQEELEMRLRSGDMASEAFVALVAKYKKLVPALALIFACVDSHTTGQPLGSINQNAMQLAAAWADFLEQHAVKLYAGTLRPDLQSAHELVKRIRKSEVKDRCTPRDIYRKGWSFLATSQKVDAALTVLEECNWLRVEHTAHTGGRPTEVIVFHPQILMGALP